jgi:hypothetical protein
MGSDSAIDARPAFMLWFFSAVCVSRHKYFKDELQFDRDREKSVNRNP